MGMSGADLVHYPQTRITSLSNGLRVATETSPSNNLTATIGVFIDAGSRWETAADNGVAHFLEHLAFKGTNKRTRTQLETEVEDMGGHLNAYTSREQTVYYAQVVKKDVPQACDILSDILLNSKYDDYSITQERNTILKEMESVYKDSKEELILDHLHQNAFQGCPLGYTILGSVANIEKIDKMDIEKYVKTHYTADRMVLAAAGAVDHDEMVKLAEKMFASVPSQPPSGMIPFKAPADFIGCDYDERWDEMETAYVAFAYPTCGWNSPDTYPLMMYSQLLGEGHKGEYGSHNHVSELHRKLLGNLDNVNYVDRYMTFNTLYSDTGLIGIYYECHPYDLNYATMLSRSSMTKYGYFLSIDELNFVRNKVKASVLFNLANTTMVCEDIGRQVLVHGRRIHPSEMFARFDEVDVNAVKNVCQKYTVDRDHCLAALGPTHELPDYNIIRKRSIRHLQ